MHSYGLSFSNLNMELDVEPQLKWIYWKWSRHGYSLGDFGSHPQLKLTTPWMVHDKTVLQQCILENYGEEDIKVDIEFCKSMTIRDLDHLDQDNSFNGVGMKDHGIRLGPKGYSWVCVHKFPDNTPGPETPGSRDPARGSAHAENDETRGSISPTPNST